jgi:aminopeptidase N
MPKKNFLKDYKKPQFKLNYVELEFKLDKKETQVNSVLSFTKLDKSANILELFGEDLKYSSIKINDILQVTNKDFILYEDKIELKTDNFNDNFNVKVSVTNFPESNTKLSGLYQSGDILVTQNEPEGFRRITYFPDRPDMMTKFKTKIIANKNEFPLLLSNGNLIEKGDLENDLHYTVWEDPFLKPSYLFALVAGKLDFIEDKFITSSGREIKLQIYTDIGKSEQAKYAMTSLQKAMKWDEERFNLEYDLDTYMIVAVDSFNSGAMENKGLNVFNSSYVLIDPNTATDQDYMNVDAVVAHEYFHNWTGNRITCRDWFQLTLKEGLTVFREQLFCEDIVDPTIQRIIDVDRLKNFQFIEDNGTNAHPIQPKSYIEIDNFYTFTVYEKGSEVIRMLHTLLGEIGFQKGMKLYFERHDETAVTTDDFVQAMSDANNIDLTSFKLWYDIAGTPELFIRKNYDYENNSLKVEFSQKNHKNSSDQVASFPFRIAIYNFQTKEIIKEEVLNITQKEENFIFEGINLLEDNIILSFNQDFSAPVKVRYHRKEREILFLLQNDKNLFNRYELMQNFLKNSVLLRIEHPRHNLSELIKTFKIIIQDKNLPNFVKSYLLKMPSYSNIIDEIDKLDINELYRAVKDIKSEIAESLLFEFKTAIEKLPITSKEDLSIEAMGTRSLKNVLMGYFAYIRKAQMDIGEYVFDLYNHSQSMTDKLACLETLNKANYQFINQMFLSLLKNNNYNLDIRKKYFMIVSSNTFKNPLVSIQKIIESDLYDENIPNLVRALIVGFAKNYRYSLSSDGKGLDFLLNQVKKFDEKNPALASAILKSFQFYEKLDKKRQNMIKEKFKGFYESKEISSNSYEILSKFYISV